MSQLIEEYLLDAVATVSAWDLDDGQFADAVNMQARLMAGVTSDETWMVDSDATTQ
jgi:hypothetical protein